MRLVTFAVSALALIAVAFSCSSGQEATSPKCVPGAVSSCPCLDGTQGVQTCNGDGTAFESCMGCGDTGSAATGGSAGNGGTGATDGSAGTGTLGCNEGDCSGCADCVATCVCQGGTQTDCESSCSAAGGTGGTGGSGTGGSAGAAIVGQVVCGATTPDLCAVGSEKCCVLEPGVDYCAPSGDDCQCEGFSCSVLEALCDGTEDCSNGEVCCGRWDGFSYSQFECRSSCDPGNFEFEICHEGISQCAEAGTTCAPSQYLPTWYQRCRN